MKSSFKILFKTSYINQYFDHVYVLNQKKHTDRKIVLLQKLGNLGISATFVESEEEKVLHFFKEILKDARNRNFSRILFLNDEVTFHKDFENQFQKTVQNIPEDWKLISLGGADFNWKNTFAIGIQKVVFDTLLSELLEENDKNKNSFLKISTAHPKECIVLQSKLIIINNTEGGFSKKESLNEFNYPFKKDLVSVIMPAFNAERTIEKSIRSILLQTYEELEIIIADDASTDRTAEIVRTLMKEDERIRLIVLEKNKGVMFARNEALKLAGGSLIAIQDADDISLKNRIEKLLIPIYEKGMLVTMSSIYRSRCLPGELDIFDQSAMMNFVENQRIQESTGDYVSEDRPILGLQTSVYQRCVFEDFGIFEDYRVAGDSEFLERILFFQIKKTFEEPINGFRFVELNESIPNTFEWLDEILLVSVQMNEQNITNQFKKRQKELRSLKKEFRKKIATGDLNAFQKLKKSNFPKLPRQGFNTLNIDINNQASEIFRNELKSKPSHQKIGAEIRDIHNSLSWKITAPLRWFGKFLFKK